MRTLAAILLLALAAPAAVAGGPSCRKAERQFQRCSSSGCPTLDRHDAMAQLLACASRRKASEARSVTH